MRNEDYRKKEIKNQPAQLLYFKAVPANSYTNLQSKVYRGGKEEATQAYSNIRRGADDAANKGRRMNANWY
jgi:hypothetical protein